MNLRHGSRHLNPVFDMPAIRVLCLWCCLIYCVSLNAAVSAEQFWKWFAAERYILESESNDKSAILNKLTAQLAAYNEDISYDIQFVNKGKRELIISANGIHEVIASVEQLCAAAPKISGWDIVSFRQPVKQFETLKLVYKDLHFKPDALYFKVISDGSYLDVELYYPNYDKKREDDYTMASFTFLDMALGEYEVMTRIRYIEHAAMPVQLEKGNVFPLTHIKKVVAAFQKHKSSVAYREIERLVKSAHVQIYNSEKPLFRKFQKKDRVKENKRLVAIVSDKQTDAFSEELQAIMLSLKAQRKKIMYFYTDEKGQYHLYRPDRIIKQ